MMNEKMGKSKKETQIPEIVLHRSAGCLLHAGFLVSLFFNTSNGGDVS
jgi:hypothetical protein